MDLPRDLPVVSDDLRQQIENAKSAREFDELLAHQIAVRAYHRGHRTVAEQRAIWARAVPLVREFVNKYLIWIIAHDDPMLGHAFQFHKRDMHSYVPEDRVRRRVRLILEDVLKADTHRREVRQRAVGCMNVIVLAVNLIVAEELYA